MSILLSVPSNVSACSCTDHAFRQAPNIYIVELDDENYENERFEAERRLKEIEERYGITNENGIERLVDSYRSGDQKRIDQFHRESEAHKKAESLVDVLWTKVRKFKVWRTVRGQSKESFYTENDRYYCSTIDVRSHSDFYLMAVIDLETHKINGCNTRRFSSIQQATEAAKRYSKP